jgi:hypothetical protein
LLAWGNWSENAVGIGYHAFQFLRFAAKHAHFGRVATIGRQELGLDKRHICRLLDVPAYQQDKYCESLLLRHFGAMSVESWDCSAYEGATHIADMNKPLRGQVPVYDTVIDGGSLEHVYNVSQALFNVSQLCREGGQILHISPGNNCCGHGFWQFSPELFFSLYCESNGYLETRVFLTNEYRTDVWYEVRKPEHGERANVISFTPTYVLCRTVKAREHHHEGVQQSDYVHVWQQNDAAQPAVKARPAWRAKLAAALQRSALVDLAYIAHIRWSSEQSLSTRNPHLIMCSVSALTQ